MTSHDSRLDMFRVIAAFFVIWLHISAVVVTTSSGTHNSIWWVGNLADSLSRWCVPIFVMVSGALLLSRFSVTETALFYRRRAIRLFPPLAFWSVFYLLLKYRHGVNLDDAIAIIKSLAKGTPYFHLWYLYMIIGLYFMTPFLSQMVKGVSEKLLLLLITVSFVISSVENLLGIVVGNHGTFLSSFLPFIPYFLSGYYLYTVKHRSDGSPKFLMVLFVLCAVTVAFGTAVLFPVMGPKSWTIMYSFFNPLVIVMSLCLFQLLLDFPKCSGALSVFMGRVAPITLGIYLIHPVWIAILGKIGLTPFFIHPIIGIPLTSAAIFFLSMASVELMAAIPWLRSVVK